MAKDRVVQHLRGDIKTFQKEASEDRELIKSLSKKKKKATKKRKIGKKGKLKVEKVMREYKKGELRSGSKKGPKVKSRKQAVAIALSEGRRESRVKRKKKK